MHLFRVAFRGKDDKDQPYNKDIYVIAKTSFGAVKEVLKRLGQYDIHINSIEVNRYQEYWKADE